MMSKGYLCSATEAFQAPPKPTATMSLLTIDASPFEGLVLDPFEPIGLVLIFRVGVYPSCYFLLRGNALTCDANSRHGLSL